jgi:hypothetical protein|tara:strand:+ start:475 stop:822 length:348 start_codon:yes stop_codon:yes gene_type:complete
LSSKKLNIVFQLLPLSLFASGGYVLEALAIDLFIFIVFLIFIIKVKLNLKGKIILICAYIVSMIVLFQLIDSVNYLDNLKLINLSSGILPTLTVIIVYYLIRNKFKREKTVANTV